MTDSNIHPHFSEAYAWGLVDDKIVALCSGVTHLYEAEVGRVVFSVYVLGCALACAICKYSEMILPSWNFSANIARLNHACCEFTPNDAKKHRNMAMLSKHTPCTFSPALQPPPLLPKTCTPQSSTFSTCLCNHNHRMMIYHDFKL